MHEEVVGKAWSGGVNKAGGVCSRRGYKTSVFLYLPLADRGSWGFKLLRAKLVHGFTITKVRVNLKFSVNSSLSDQVMGFSNIIPTPTPGKFITYLTAQAASYHHNKFLLTWHIGYKCAGGTSYFFFWFQFGT